MQYPTAKSLKDYPIIAISGKQYSGKDLLSSLLLKHLPHYTQLPLAQAIKATYAQQHSLTLEEVEHNKAHYRPGIIAIGDWGRAQDPDYWLKRVLNNPAPKIISDVRLKREYELLRDHQAFLIRLNADRAIRAQRGLIVSEEDPTERDLDKVTHWDAVFVNNGSIDELEAQLIKLL